MTACPFRWRSRSRTPASGSAARRTRGVGARLVASTLATIVLAGCAVGPNYKRPSVDAPEVTHGQIGPAEAGGRLLSNYRASEAAWEKSVRQYEANAINAFAEVSNAGLICRYRRLGGAAAIMRGGIATGSVKL